MEEHPYDLSGLDYMIFEAQLAHDPTFSPKAKLEPLHAVSREKNTEHTCNAPGINL